MFNWLRGWCGAKKPEPIADERREALRYARDRKSSNRLVASLGSAGWPAVVADLSTTGIGLVVGIRQEPGTWLPVRLFNQKRKVTCPMQAQVVRSEQGFDGYWLTGCVFRDTLNEQEIAELI